MACLGTAVAAVVFLSGCDAGDFDFDFDDVDFDLSFSDDEDSEDEEASPEDEEGEEEDEEDEEDGADEEEASGYGLPDSCENAGVTQIVGDLAPGGVLSEEGGEVDGIDDAEQIVCTLSDGGGEADTPSFTLVFTVNADPSANPELVEVPGSEAEMNWEVDVDVDVDTYHTDESDDLGGDLEYVGAIDGSSSHLYLELPDDFYVAAITNAEGVDRDDLERVVMEAAEQVRT